MPRLGEQRRIWWFEVDKYRDTGGWRISSLPGIVGWFRVLVIYDGRPYY